MLVIQWLPMSRHTIMHQNHHGTKMRDGWTRFYGAVIMKNEMKEEANRLDRSDKPRRFHRKCSDYPRG